MIQFLEEQAGKNLHLEHIEDEIINFGVPGGRGAINFLRSLRDMLAGSARSSVNMTVKWDGAPAIFAGTDPSDGKFFVAKKSVFNVNPKLYKSNKEIDDDVSGDLNAKFKVALKEFSKLGIKGVLQGDLMFTDDDKKEQKIDDIEYITFQPNTILYAIQKDSKLGETIDNAKYGIVFHTSYSGGTIDDLTASFGVDISTLGASSDIWLDDASYKDVSGNSTLTAKETVALTKALSETGKAFRKIKKPALIKFMKVQETIASKGAGATYKTYVNTQIRKGKFDLSYKKYLSYFDDYWKKKVVDKVKMEKTKEMKRKMGDNLRRELMGAKVFIDALCIFQTQLVVAKDIVIKGLNKAKSIGTFVVTDKGLKTVNPEGYVAIDKEGKAVKLVDRMEFSLNNFTVAKNWNK